jgi:hypothetical protein
VDGVVGGWRGDCIFGDVLGRPVWGCGAASGELWRVGIGDILRVGWKAWGTLGMRKMSLVSKDAVELGP